MTRGSPSSASAAFAAAAVAAAAASPSADFFEATSSAATDVATAVVAAFVVQSPESEEQHYSNSNLLSSAMSMISCPLLGMAPAITEYAGVGTSFPLKKKGHAEGLQIATKAVGVWLEHEQEAPVVLASAENLSSPPHSAFSAAAAAVVVVASSVVVAVVSSVVAVVAAAVSAAFASADTSVWKVRRQRHSNQRTNHPSGTQHQTPLTTSPTPRTEKKVRTRWVEGELRHAGWTDHHYHCQP